MPLPVIGFGLGAIGAFLSRVVASRIGYWILAALTFFGLQFVATEFVADPLLAQIQAAFAGAPAEILEWLAFLNVDKYITMILSAYAAAAAVGSLRLRKVAA